PKSPTDTDRNSEPRERRVRSIHPPAARRDLAGSAINVHRTDETRRTRFQEVVGEEAGGGTARVRDSTNSRVRLNSSRIPWSNEIASAGASPAPPNDPSTRPSGEAAAA